MSIGHSQMHQTTSLILQIWQGLCSKHSVAFSNSKNSCNMRNKLDSKCNRQCHTSSKQGSNLSTEFKKQAKSFHESQVFSWQMSLNNLILRGSISPSTTESAPGTGHIRTTTKGRPPKTIFWGNHGWLSCRIMDIFHELVFPGCHNP